LEDLRELLVGRRVEADLERDAAEERFVDQVLRLEVRREEDELVERDLDLLAGVEREEVHALFQRDDPAVEEVLRAALLAAEVVDEEDSAVRLELERRLVELRVLVIDEVEVLERELATDHDERTLRLDPAQVHALLLHDGGDVVLVDVALDRL